MLAKVSRLVAELFAYISDHPKFWGIVAFIALAVTFSPRASLMASWICIAFAWVISATLIGSIKRLRMSRWPKTYTLVWVLVVGAVYGAFGIWLAPSKTMPTPDLAAVYQPFREIWYRHQRELGKPFPPKKPDFSSELAAYQVFDHARVIWLKEPMRHYLLPEVSDKQWSPEPDADVSGKCEWYSEDSLRSKRAFKECPKDRKPPRGGAARLWVGDPEHWKWIGWWKDDCSFEKDVIKYQEFENGLMIGMLPASSDKPAFDDGLVFVLVNGNKWWSELAGGHKAPRCIHVPWKCDETTFANRLP